MGCVESNFVQTLSLCYLPNYLSFKGGLSAQVRPVSLSHLEQVIEKDRGRLELGDAIHVHTSTQQIRPVCRMARKSQRRSVPFFSSPFSSVCLSLFLNVVADQNEVYWHKCSKSEEGSTSLSWELQKTLSCKKNVREREALSAVE